METLRLRHQHPRQANNVDHFRSIQFIRHFVIHEPEPCFWFDHSEIYFRKGVPVKLTNSLQIAVLLALALIVGCAKSETPATSTQNTPASTDSGAGGTATAAKTQESVVIPAGTTMVVRLGETLSSKQNQAGDSFSATLARPVVVGGKTVIEQGARARGTVVDAKGMGHFKGGALLEVRLTSVDINGREHSIQTAAVEREVKGKGRRSAGFIGGGAGAGALIGALAGGGKGAAIGALAGAGAGTAGAAYTGNKEIVLPAESSLSFRLTHAVELK
jgi:hypothetical protein